MGPLMGAIKTLDNGTPELTVSHLNKKGKNYLVIIHNPFPFNSQKDSGTADSVSAIPVATAIRLQFNEYWKISEIKTQKGQLVPTVLERTNYNPTYLLQKGSYLVFSWE